MPQIANISRIGNALWTTLKKIGTYDIPKKSAALAYYTIFSIAPIFFLILSLGSIFWGDEILNGTVFNKLEQFLGFNIALTLQNMLVNTRIESTSILTGAFSVGTLMFAATGVFVEIQSSINDIWEVEAKVTKRAFWHYIKNRLLSFSIIVALGFLLLVSLLINSALEVLHDQIATRLDQFSEWITFGVNNLVLVSVVSLLFFLIFKVLPDVKLGNKVSLTGAFLTTILFLIGRYVIGIYLGRSDLKTVFGASGTIVILLSWVYYTSIILFFGAAFTKNLAMDSSEKLESSEHANFVEKKKKVITDEKMKENSFIKD